MKFRETPDLRFENLPDYDFAPNYVAVDDDEGGLYLPVDSPDVANARNEFAVFPLSGALGHSHTVTGNPAGF